MKELLGEELYNQVKEKLGDKELIINDGNYIPKHKFDDLNNDKKELKKQLEEVNAKVQELSSVDAEKLMTLCDLSGVIIARGSACQSHVPTPSKALKAIGLTDAQALSTIRISLDEFNTVTEIDEAADIITKLVERIRNEEN